MAITEYHRLGGLNNKRLFFTLLEAGESKIKVPADSVSGKTLLPVIYKMSNVLRRSIRLFFKK